MPRTAGIGYAKASSQDLNVLGSGASGAMVGFNRANASDTPVQLGIGVRKELLPNEQRI